MADCLPKLSLFSNEQPRQLSRWVAHASFQLYGLLLAVLGWMFTIISSASDQWQIWDVASYPSLISGRIQIGIWRVCSRLEEINMEGLDWHCHYYMNEHSCLPIEIFMAQDLMALACVLQSSALVLMFFALWTISSNEKERKLFLTFFNTGVVLNLVSAICILISTSWNTYSILQKEPVQFPKDFNLPYLPKKQQVGFAIYIGYVAALCQLLNTLLNLCNTFGRSKKTIPFLFMTTDPLIIHFRDCPQVHIGLSV